MLATSDLARHERLLIWRRRADLNQAQAADYFDITTWAYRQAENGEGDVPAVKIGKLAPNEAAVILRRREGMSRTALAKALDVSPWWLTQMERGQQDPQRLIDYWSEVKSR